MEGRNEKLSDERQEHVQDREGGKTKELMWKKGNTE